FEDSALGEIPTGWEVKPLGELIELAYGKALKEEHRRHGPVPVFGGLAKDMRAANARGEALGLSDEELAFYDALEVKDSAGQVLGEAGVKAIAREVAEAGRRNVTIDWTVREQMRVRVRRILRKYGYPPDKQERATQLVLEQAEVLSYEWAAA